MTKTTGATRISIAVIGHVKIARAIIAEMAKTTRLIFSLVKEEDVQP